MSDLSPEFGAFPQARFHDIPVVPYTELMHHPAKASFHRGGPAFPGFALRTFERHSRNGRITDKEPLVPDDIAHSPTLRGSYVWAGAVCPHFGHQVADFSHRLLMARRLFPGAPLLVGTMPETGFITPQTLPRYASEIYAYAGYDAGRIHVAAAPVRVEELLVCAQGQQMGRPPAPIYLDRIAEHMRAAGVVDPARRKLQQRVFVTRQRLPPSFGRVLGEGYIADALARAGFEIYVPQAHPFRHQIETYANAGTLVFTEGSAVHGLDLITDLERTYLIHRRTGPLAAEFHHVVAPRSRAFSAVDRIHWVGTAAPSGDTVRGVSFVDPAALDAFFADVGARQVERVPLCEAILREFEFYLAAPIWRNLLSPDDRERTFDRLRDRLRERLIDAGLTGGTTRPTSNPSDDETVGSDTRAIGLPMENHSARRINRLGRAAGASSYLEIGVQKGLTFFAVDIDRKVAVDPKFLFSTTDSAVDGTTFHQMTSDDYFQRDERDPYDIVFIDGLHTFEQTYRDLCNVLLRTHERSIIVIDDTVPIDVYSAISDHARSLTHRQRAAAPGEPWHGDVFKVVFAIHDFHPLLSYRTIVGGGNAQTIVWRRTRGRFAPRFNSLEAVSRLSYFDMLDHFDVMNADDENAVLAEVEDFIAGGDARMR